MKPELEQHRRGLGWDDRWLLFDDETGDLLPEDTPLWPAPEPWQQYGSYP